VIRGYPGEMAGVISETSPGDPLGDLHHCVYYSPPGYSGGDFTNGAKELARCILVAVLGERARCTAYACTRRVSGSGAPRPHRPRPDEHPPLAELWWWHLPRVSPSVRARLRRALPSQPWHITAVQVPSWLAEMAPRCSCDRDVPVDAELPANADSVPRSAVGLDDCPAGFSRAWTARVPTSSQGCLAPGHCVNDKTVYAIGLLLRMGRFECQSLDRRCMGTAPRLTS
jgi:hypothetical protein